MENPFKPKLFNPEQKGKIEELTNSVKSDPDVVYKRDKPNKGIRNNYIK